MFSQYDKKESKNLILFASIYFVKVVPFFG